MTVLGADGFPALSRMFSGKLAMML